MLELLPSGVFQHIWNIQALRIQDFKKLGQVCKVLNEMLNKLFRLVRKCDECGIIVQKGSCIVRVMVFCSPKCDWDFHRLLPSRRVMEDNNTSECGCCRRGHRFETQNSGIFTTRREKANENPSLKIWS